MMLRSGPGAPRALADAEAAVGPPNEETAEGRAWKPPVADIEEPGCPVMPPRPIAALARTAFGNKRAIPATGMEWNKLILAIEQSKFEMECKANSTASVNIFSGGYKTYVVQEWR